MKKQQKEFLVLAFLLGICLAGYFGLSVFNRVKEEKEAAANSVEILQIPEDTVKSLTFTIEDTEYTFEKNGDIWTCATDPTIPVNGTVMDVKVSYLAELKGKQEISSRNDLEGMGLENPANIVTIVTTEGNYELTMGSYNEMLTGYYMSYQEQIYLVSSNIYSAFNCTLDSIEVAENSTENNTENSTENE